MKIRDRMLIRFIVRGAVRRRARTIEDLTAYCAERTGKEIRLTPLRGLTSVTGVVARDDDNNRADIFYADSDGEWRRRITITHELAHLFLDHTCAHSDSPDIRDILALITRLPRSAVIRALENASFEQRPSSERARGQADSYFEDPDERAAETLASKLLVLTLISDADFNSLSTYQSLVSDASVVTTFLGPR